MRRLRALGAVAVLTGACAKQPGVVENPGTQATTAEARNLVTCAMALNNERIAAAGDVPPTAFDDWGGITLEGITNHRDQLASAAVPYVLDGYCDDMGFYPYSPSVNGTTKVDIFGPRCKVYTFVIHVDGKLILHKAEMDLSNSILQNNACLRTGRGVTGRNRESVPLDGHLNEEQVETVRDAAAACWNALADMQVPE